jgi:hypothetical protein
MVPASRVVRGSLEQAERASEAASNNPKMAENDPDETFLALITTPLARAETRALLMSSSKMLARQKRAVKQSFYRSAGRNYNMGTREPFTQREQNTVRRGMDTVGGGPTHVDEDRTARKSR